MRLTSLLDTITADTTASVTALPNRAPKTSLTAAPATQGMLDEDNLDRFMSAVLPCRTNDPELWFAEQTVLVERAKALCRACPLVAGCLAGAVDRQEPWGVWGGEVFIDGAVAPSKRGRGRPRKVA